MSRPFKPFSDPLGSIRATQIMGTFSSTRVLLLMERIRKGIFLSSPLVSVSLLWHSEYLGSFEGFLCTVDGGNRPSFLLVLTIKECQS